jgi:addiction module RelB/DinJ family antitoxin
MLKAMNFKVEESIKESFEKIAGSIGISTSELLNILVKRTVDEQGLPFELKKQGDVVLTEEDLDDDFVETIVGSTQEILDGKTHSLDEAIERMNQTLRVINGI